MQNNVVHQKNHVLNNTFGKKTNMAIKLINVKISRKDKKVDKKRYRNLNFVVVGYEIPNECECNCRSCVSNFYAG